MRHIRKTINDCESCPKEWVAHSREERASTGLCMWWSLDTGTVCKLLLPCNLHPGREKAAIADWRDPNAPVRLGFIESDHNSRLLKLDAAIASLWSYMHDNGDNLELRKAIGIIRTEQMRVTAKEAYRDT
jgi:hypothetical protein